MRGRAKGAPWEGALAYAMGSAHLPARLPARPSLGTPPHPPRPSGYLRGTSASAMQSLVDSTSR